MLDADAIRSARMKQKLIEPLLRSLIASPEDYLEDEHFGALAQTMLDFEDAQASFEESAALGLDQGLSLQPGRALG